MSTSKPWARTRPRKPDVDPLHIKIVRLLREDKRSTWAQANVSGLSTSTLTNWQNGKVKRPQSVSLQMAARMLGKRIDLVD